MRVSFKSALSGREREVETFCVKSGFSSCVEIVRIKFKFRIDLNTSMLHLVKRAVVKILDKVGPSLNAINETAHSLARYAAICQ
eukprot:1381149-Amorphochlora_amoeboformis.AAC.1